MELAPALSQETGAASPDEQAVSRTDGLAAAVAVEQGALATASAGPETPGVGSKPKGRPPIHGRYSRAAGSDGKNPVPPPGPEPLPVAEAEAPAPARVVIPPDLLGKVVQETLSLGERFAESKIKGVAARAGLSAPEIEPQLAQARMGEQRKEVLGLLTPLAMEEWGLDPEMSPSAAICVLLMPWSLGAFWAWLTLSNLAMEKEAKEKHVRPGKSPENTN